MNLFDNPRFKKFLTMLTKQAEDGVPIEAQGFVDHPYDAPDMPSVEYQGRKTRPKWVDNELEGWEQLSD